MWCTGDAHKEMRNFAIRTLKTFGFGELKVTEGHLQEEMKEMITDLDNEIENAKDNVVYFHQPFKIPTFNFLWRIIGGTRYPYNDIRIKKLIEAVEDVSSINIGIDPEWHFPILRFIPGLSPSRAKRESFVVCYMFFVVSKLESYCILL